MFKEVNKDMNNKTKDKFKIIELCGLSVLLLILVFIIEFVIFLFLDPTPLKEFDVKVLIILGIISYIFISITLNQFKKYKLAQFVFIFSLILISLTHLYFTGVFEKTYRQDTPEVILKIENRDTPVVYQSSVFEALDTSDSSFVNFALYDKKEFYLILGLSGKNYQYCEVPQYLWSNFKKSESFGSFYNKNIKGDYSCNSSQEPKYIGEACLNNAVKVGVDFLATKGYYGKNSNSEGPYINQIGEFPTTSVSDQFEKIMNYEYLRCLN